MIGSGAVSGVAGTVSPARSRSESQPERAALVVDDQRVRKVGSGDRRPRRRGRLANPDERRLPEVDVSHAQKGQALQRPIGADEVLDEVVRGAHQQLGGVAYWASMPPFWSTATRSPILIASSMSWVTNRIVFLISDWRRRNWF